MAEKGASIVIRRVRKVRGGGHHGGAWKVAFADFATAMMAFFLLMWLIAATTKEQRGGIAEYFNNQSLVAGKSSSPNTGPNGPGGASTSMIKMGGVNNFQPEHAPIPTAREVKQAAKAEELKKLQALMKDLTEAIEKTPSLQQFKDQLFIDITPAGLRIQIVDRQNRPMFDIGSAALKPYTIEILHELSKYIESVPNRVSISGHTDMIAYGSQTGYTNWELSADRANAARRALIAGGLSDEKIVVVVGLASSVLFDKTSPQAPINRRISIIIMNHEAEAAATGQQEEEEYAGGEPDLGQTGAAAATPEAASGAASSQSAIEPKTAVASAASPEPKP